MGSGHSNDDERETKKAIWWYNDVCCVMGDLKDYIASLSMLYHDYVEMDFLLKWKLSSSHYCVNLTIYIGSKTLDDIFCKDYADGNGSRS